MEAVFNFYPPAESDSTKDDEFNKLSKLVGM